MSQPPPLKRQIQGQWQASALDQLTEFLQTDEDVLLVALVGSGTHTPDMRDVWSDLDVLIVLRDAALNNYFPRLDWLANLGDIFAYEVHDNGYTRTLRICFYDFRRFDLILSTQSALMQIDKWSHTVAWKKRRTLISRLPALETALDQTQADYVPAIMPLDKFETLVNGFWFKGVVALTKLARHDHIIALHLSLDLIRDCLVLAMILRDRQGGNWNHVIEQLDATQHSFTVEGILDSLEHSAITFDTLAAQYTPAYRAHHETFSQWIDFARHRLLDNL